MSRMFPTFWGNSGATLDEGAPPAVLIPSDKGNIEEDILYLLGRVVSEDGSLDSDTTCDGLIGDDASVRLLAAEEVRHELDDTGHTGGSANEDDIVDGVIDFGVTEELPDRLHSFPEKIHVKLLELGPGERLREVIAVLERFDLNISGLLAGERRLGLLDLTF